MVLCRVSWCTTYETVAVSLNIALCSNRLLDCNCDEFSELEHSGNLVGPDSAFNRDAFHHRIQPRSRHEIHASDKRQMESTVECGSAELRCFLWQSKHVQSTTCGKLAEKEFACLSVEDKAERCDIISHFTVHTSTYNYALATVGRDAELA